MYIFNFNFYICDRYWFSVGIWYILFYNAAIIIIYINNSIFYSVPNLSINIRSIEL